MTTTKTTTKIRPAGGLVRQASEEVDDTALARALGLIGDAAGAAPGAPPPGDGAEG